jgi:hypothetical protein
VEPKDVLSGVVNMVESSPLGPAALTPATADRRITKVVRATSSGQLRGESIAPI